MVPIVKMFQNNTSYTMYKALSCIDIMYRDDNNMFNRSRVERAIKITGRCQLHCHVLAIYIIIDIFMDQLC